MHGKLNMGYMLPLLISSLNLSLPSISLLLHDFISNRRTNILELWRAVSDNTEKIKKTRYWEVYLSWIYRNLFYKVFLNVLLMVTWTLKQSWSIMYLSIEEGIEKHACKTCQKLHIITVPLQTKSIIEIRIPIEGCNFRKILKWTEKSNSDLMTSLAEESSIKKNHLLKNLVKCNGKEAEPISSPS